MNKPKVPELVAKQREGGYIRQFQFTMKREAVEGRTDEYIKGNIEEVLTNLSELIFKELLICRERWEEETRKVMKFLGKEGVEH